MERKVADSYSNKKKEKGEYKTLVQMVELEGGFNNAAAVRVAMNYAHSCILEKGEMLQWHERKKTWQFLYIRDQKHEEVEHKRTLANVDEKQLDVETPSGSSGNVLGGSAPLPQVGGALEDNHTPPKVGGALPENHAPPPKVGGAPLAPPAGPPPVKNGTVPMPPVTAGAVPPEDVPKQSGPLPGQQSGALTGQQSGALTGPPPPPLGSRRQQPGSTGKPGKNGKNGKNGKVPDQLTAQYKKCSDLVGDLKTSMADACSLLYQIDNIREWEWAHAHDKPILKAAYDKVFPCQTAFYNQFVAHKNLNSLKALGVCLASWIKRALDSYCCLGPTRNNLS